MTAKQNLLEALLAVLAEREPDLDEAIEAMLIIVGRLAVDQGLAVAVFAMLADAIEGTMESDDRMETRARLQ